MKFKSRGIIHRIAYCEKCDWSDDDYGKCLDRARIHAKKTGHRINVETGTWGTFN